MSDICESCGCPDGVDGHDVLYRQINELKETVNKNNGINNLATAIGTMDAEERKLLTDEIHRLERLIERLQKVVDAADSLWRSDKGDTEAEAYLWREVEAYIVWKNEQEEKESKRPIGEAFAGTPEHLQPRGGSCTCGAIGYTDHHPGCALYAEKRIEGA